MKFSMIQRTFLSSLAIALFLGGCAQQGSPGGGEGDVTSPRFLRVKPQSQSINVPVDRSVIVEFNEWVEPVSVKKAVTIHPTISGGFEIKVDRRQITITPNDSFAKNTTYHININGELADFYRNRLAEPVNCVFSTGSSIDSGTMTGGAVTEDDTEKSPLKAALFFSARLDTTLDTTLLGEPDYLVQCDSLDRFKFENINENSYSVIAFRDKNSDNRLTPGETVYFPKSKLVGTGTVTDILLFKGVSDTTRWKISKIVQASSEILTGIVAPSRIPDSAAIVQTETQKRIIIKTSRILSDSSTILMTTETAIPAGQYDLICWWPNRFSAGKNLPKNDTLPYTAAVADTVRFNAVPPSDSIKTKFLGWKIINEKSLAPQLKLSWSNPVNFTATLEFSDSTGNRYPLILAGSPEKELLFRAKGKLLVSKNLSIVLKPELFKGLNGSGVAIADSVVTFKTVDDKDLAMSLLLNYANCTEYLGWQWELMNTVRGSSVAIPLRRVSNDLIAEEIPAASYTVSLFEDRNGNGIQDRGSLFPRVSAEPRIFLPDTVKAKARWRTEVALQTRCSLLKVPTVISVDSAVVDSNATSKSSAVK